MTSKIPKIIHYIWLGKKEMPESFIISKSSVDRHAKDFEVKIWTEEDISEFDLPEYFYTLMKDKKYAFASDVLRFHILDKYGGVYLDVDQVLVKDISHLISQTNVDFFLAKYHEVDDYYGFGFLGSVIGSDYAGSMKDFYKNYKGEDYMIVNKIGSDIINQNRNLSVKIFDQEYFYPLTAEDYTENTYAYHMANTSWVPMYKRVLLRMPLYDQLKSLAKRILPASIKKKLGFNVRY